jgi:hypothetical protein
MNPTTAVSISRAKSEVPVWADGVAEAWRDYERMF